MHIHRLQYAIAPLVLFDATISKSFFNSFLYYRHGQGDNGEGYVITKSKIWNSGVVEV